MHLCCSSYHTDRVLVDVLGVIATSLVIGWVQETSRTKIPILHLAMVEV